VGGEVIAKHFVALGGSNEGAEWLTLLWDAIQGLDDWYDNDHADNPERTIHIVLHDLWAHPFFRQHGTYLLPHLSAMVLKWRAANQIEEEGRANERSFMWRAGFYDVVLMCLALCIGPEMAGRAAHKVVDMYGETLDEYLKEMNHA
jgi:hypothetical protein